MRIVNLTRHTVYLVIGHNFEIEIPSSGDVTVCSDKRETGEFINGVPVVKRIVFQIMGLPKPRKNTIYLVNRVVAESVWPSGRTDVFTFSARKDAQNKIRYRTLEANPYHERRRN